MISCDRSFRLAHSKLHSNVLIHCLQVTLDDPLIGKSTFYKVLGAPEFCHVVFPGKGRLGNCSDCELVKKYRSLKEIRCCATKREQVEQVFQDHLSLQRCFYNLPTLF